MHIKEEAASAEAALRALDQAIERDDLASVARALLSRPALARQGESLLRACELGKTEAARLLLDAGADPNHATRPSGAERPLSRLCQAHRAGAWSPAHRALADLLVARGVDPRAPVHEGDQPALLFAARCGNLEAVLFLSAVLARREQAPNPWEAAALGDVARVQALLAEDAGWARRIRSAGAGAFLTHWTLLTLAASSRLGACDLRRAAALGEVAQLLLTAGASPRAEARGDQLVESPVGAAARAGNTTVLSALLGAGGDPNEALGPALREEQREVLELLEGHELALDQTANAKTGASLLHDLAQWGRFEAAAWLLGRGASPDPRDDLGLTPLHYAVRRGCAPADVAIFLEAGADPAARDRRGRSPLDYARERGRAGLYEVLEAERAG